MTSAGASLGLFQPSQDGGLSADLSLTQFYRAYVRPQVLVLAAERNLHQYDETMCFWAQYTLDPPLRLFAELGRKLCANFLKGLKGRTYCGEPIASNTIRKHCVHAQAVIDLAGPRSRKNPAAAALIDDPPLILKPSVVVGEVEDVFTLEELAKQYEAADVMREPAYWRALLPFAYNSAFRAGTLWALTPKWLVEDELGWWAKVPSNKSAIKGGRGRKFFLTPSAMDALQPLLSGASPTERILKPRCCRRFFYTLLHELQCEAGLPPARHFSLHAIRKSCNTELVQINPMAARWHLGHASNDINRDHYTHRRALVAAVLMLPQPHWRTRRQMRLF